MYDVNKQINKIKNLQNRLDESIEAYKSAIGLDPKQGLIYNSIGKMYLI